MKRWELQAQCRGGLFERRLFGCVGLRFKRQPEPRAKHNRSSGAGGPTGAPPSAPGGVELRNEALLSASLDLLQPGITPALPR